MPADGSAPDWFTQARAAAAHVFVDDLERPSLATDDRHHLVRVLRLRSGEAVSTVDGQGGWRLCTYLAEGVVEPAGDVERPPEARPELTIAMAVTKGDRPEWAVQKLTEIGVDRVALLVTDRSVVRWDGERVDRHLRRLREVARQAAMQSRRLRVPVIEAPARVADLLGRDRRGVVGDRGAVVGDRGVGDRGAVVGDRGAGDRGVGDRGAVVGDRGAGDRGAVDGGDRGGVVAGPAPWFANGGMALAAPGGEPPTLERPTVLVGPEGGWSAAELEMAPAVVDLGRSVLRTETAAVMAASVLSALRYRLVYPARQ